MNSRAPTSWLLWLALFLSLGFNFGLLAGRWADGAGDGDGDIRAATRQGHPESELDGRLDEDPDLGSDPEPAPKVPPKLRRTVERVAVELRLDGDDRERYFELQKEFFGRTLSARREARRTQQQLRKLLVSGAAERAEVDRLMARLTAAQGEAETAFFDHYFAMRELLDAQQMRRYSRFLGHLRRLSDEMQQTQRRRG